MKEVIKIFKQIQETSSTNDKKAIIAANKDNELFKKLTDNIWEFRTRYQGMAYRLLAFWDKDMKALVIATHGFIKKKQKTPSNEIKRAEDLMKKYYER